MKTDKVEKVCLFDMDGTLVGYSQQMLLDLQKLAFPGEPPPQLDWAMMGPKGTVGAEMPPTWRTGSGSSSHRGIGGSTSHELSQASRSWTWPERLGSRSAF